jgi:histone deacetylase 1/2
MENKHKARLCAHGGQQTWGENYWETYAPVVNWITIRTLLALCQIHGLESRSIDFVLAFPQAELDVEVYMELPLGFDFEGISKKKYVLKLEKNLYGLKQAAHNWYEHLKQGLINRDFKQSSSDPCLYLKDDAIILVYCDDCIIFSKKKSVIEQIIKSLKEGPEQYVLTDEGDVNKYLGVEITDHKNGTYELSQPYLIERLLSVVKIDETVNAKPTPATTPLLHKDLEGLERKTGWSYRQIIGMLGYLQGSTRPDISMAVHQCARFSNDPKLSHERAVKRVCKYIQGTKDRGILFKPNESKGIEVYVDADFAGSWNKADADSPDNVLSRTGFIIYYAGCPVTWASKLQTEIALSTAEAEYIALSSAMREVIPMMSLIKEISIVCKVKKKKPEINCKVFEDNESAISIAKSNKFSPRTKHIALKYHHFRQYVKKGEIEISHINTKEQTADILTKPLNEQMFVYLRKKLIGW